MAFMTHPDLPKTDPAVTTDEAFHEVWEKKGWQLVQPTPASTPTTEPAPAARPRTTPEG